MQELNINEKNISNYLAKKDKNIFHVDQTFLSAERTMLDQIRTASIFIGVSYLIFYKINDNKIFLNFIVGFILLTILITNSISMIIYYNKTGKKLNFNNSVPIIYGFLFSLLILIFLFYLIRHGIQDQKL